MTSKATESQPQSKRLNPDQSPVLKSLRNANAPPSDLQDGQRLGRSLKGELSSEAPHPNLKPPKHEVSSEG